jgi:hypothetical protein
VCPMVFLVIRCVYTTQILSLDLHPQWICLLKRPWHSSKVVKIITVCWIKMTSIIYTSFQGLFPNNICLFSYTCRKRQTTDCLKKISMSSKEATCETGKSDTSTNIFSLQSYYKGEMGVSLLLWFIGTEVWIFNALLSCSFIYLVGKWFERCQSED